LLTRYENQDEFSKVAKMLLRDLNLLPECELNDPEDGDENEGDDQQPDQGENSDQAPEQGEGENDSQDSEQDEQTGDSEEAGDVDGMDRDIAASDEEASADAGEHVPRPAPGKDAGTELSNKLSYRLHTTKFDEIVKASELCPSDELDQLRALLDKQVE